MTQNVPADGTDFDALFHPWLLAVGYKQNATINLSYAALQDNVRLYAQSPKQILAGHAALVKKHDDFNPWQPSVIFYNPVGKILAGVAMLDFSSYSFRLHGLVAHSRLIELQRRMIEGNVGPGQRPLKMRFADPDLMNPYTENPFELDMARNAIYFAGYGERYLKDGKISVTLHDH
jgi:hypothetical protein